MSEAEFDYLLETVRAEIAADIRDDLRSEEMFFRPIPAAANDNDGVWPMIPFPDGWEATC